MIRFFVLFSMAAFPVFVFADDVPLRDRIDAAVKAAWQRKGVTPAPVADDGEFLRRPNLDLIGTMVQTKTAQKTLDAHKEWIVGLSRSPDGNTLLSGDDAGQVIVWDRLAV